MCVDASSKKLIWVKEIRLSLFASASAAAERAYAGTTLTAEGYSEPQVQAREEVEGPRNLKKTALEPRKSKDLKYSHVRAQRT